MACSASSSEPLSVASLTCSRARSSYAGASTSRKMPIGARCRTPESVSRDSPNANDGSWPGGRRARPARRHPTSSPRRRPRTHPDRGSRTTPSFDPSTPKRIGSPCVSGMIASAEVLGVLHRSERVVVEDRAVLVDLHERRAAVGGRRPEHLGQVLAVGVDGPGHEGRLGAERQRDRVERVVQRTHRRRLGDLADLGGGGVLALGQTVDPVVEQQDGQVHVAAQHVDQVVAADGERVAVAGDHEHRSVLTRGRHAGGDRGRPAVDRVHAVGVHVVREPRRAADARRR